MKFNYYAYLADKETHVIEIRLEFEADGYMTALAEANKLCHNNHDNLYVSNVVRV